MKKLYVVALSALLFSCNNNSDPDKDPDLGPPPVGIKAPETIAFTVLSQYPHDTSAYTQGLELHNGKLYEGTGDYTASSLRITDWKTGNVEKKHMMGTEDIFGEGITILNNKIYQLTWESNIVYVYDLGNIEKPVNTLKWPYQGWGITNDGKQLIISDGTANLYFVDPVNFKVLSLVSVKDNYGPVNLLNELEYVNGYVYANVYESNMIVKIDPESGHVKGKMILNGLLQQNDIVPGRTDVLNGIAYDSTTKNFLITGKRWPKLFEIKLN
jgi:glutaminyl-peptide cyclotransferase